MTWTIDGLPVHPLVVHAVAVLVPLAALGTLAVALRPSWRRPYGPLVVACSVVAVGLLPVAVESGEGLERYVGEPEQHARLGESLLWYVLPLLLLSAALVALDRRAASPSAATGPGRPASPSPTGDRPASAHGVPWRTVERTVAALAVVAAVVAVVQVGRVVETGTRAVWGDTPGAVGGRTDHDRDVDGGVDGGVDGVTDTSPDGR
ncbi:DUF2231 domain-containing protein [Nocardioides sp. GY 10127]|uniref:DUF2231 domain-containing protein n=1 Tax=Nocardioides sp. GY 10127 TaxID=2569762 RepID=UPI0010A8B513|nr:DUF2231 domain-containing protein [Nocardioides sp. GY 10127]TIC80115.1 hypothetical protein E8D37_16035 [Nocardioides sp. GY 10127]